MTDRTGMSTLVAELRRMTNCGPNDVTIGGRDYWHDDDLVDILDEHRTDIIREPLVYDPLTGAGGTVLYVRARLTVGHLEASPGTAEGTAIFAIVNGGGTPLGTADYSVDYRRGVVTFTADTAGTSYYVYARTYDLYGAAARVWRDKAGMSAEDVDFKTQEHWWYGSQRVKQCLEMASYYETQSESSGRSVALLRDDIL